MLYPINFEAKIGFDKIRDLIKERCVSEVGHQEIDKMAFGSDFEGILSELLVVEECMHLLSESEDGIPLGRIADVRSCMQRTQVEGTFLDVSDVVDMRSTLTTLHQIVSYIERRDAERFPKLVEMVKPIAVFPDVTRRIDSMLDKYGEIKDQASPELNSIRKSILRAQGSVSKILHSILKKAQEDGLVEKDTAPTIRDGRLVIPVLSMNKRKISGIVYDESATGKTSYVEPTAVVEVNNRLRELENEERREIVRILTEFTDFLRPYYDTVEESLVFLGVMDGLRSKGLFSLSIGAIKPHLTDKSEMNWYEARHPLLEMSLKRQGRAIEPLNIRLNDSQRIVLISGPNAGGKSVCLKTVGLLQYMLQCGLPIPVSERTVSGIFDRLFIDIGDEQSIENDLSTYSSHLLNMKNFIRYGTSGTLVLIDEFGTGTEPQLGGAIAQSVLERLNNIGMYGVITTHYSNLKRFAADTAGIVNGAMLYDRHEMRPLFALSIGNPGSSFAIEIARKIGLPEDVLHSAIEQVGHDHVDFEKYLQDVSRDKRYWENKRQQVKDQERRLKRLQEEYEQKLSEMRSKEKETLRKAKQEASDLLSKANAQIEQTIRTIQESKADKQKTKQVRSELSDMKRVLDKEKAVAERRSGKSEPLVVGDKVRVLGQQAVGELLSVTGKQCQVAFGQLKSSVPLAKLERVSSSEQKRMAQKGGVSKQTIDSVREKQLEFKQEIDVRGMRVDEALQAVIYFIDDAHMLGVSRVRILHGTGTGALRQAIRDYLHQTSWVSSYRDEHVQFGGAGITVVEMK